MQTARGFNPMQPYYFPFVRPNGTRIDGFIEGLFDYRPRNEQEAVVAAVSTDFGKSWFFQGEALGLNPYCPADPTDPDNKTSSSAASASPMVQTLPMRPITASATLL